MSDLQIHNKYWDWEMESGSGGTGTDFNVEARSEVGRKSPVFPLSSCFIISEVWVWVGFLQCLKIIHSFIYNFSYLRWKKQHGQMPFGLRNHGNWMDWKRASYAVEPTARKSMMQKETEGWNNTMHSNRHVISNIFKEFSLSRKNSGDPLISNGFPMGYLE